jgi:enediyne biosynthesis protein E4
VLNFGLGKAGQADEIELRWPSGQVDRLSKVAAGQTITVKEGSGIVQQRAFGSAAPAAQSSAQRKAGR